MDLLKKVQSSIEFQIEPLQMMNLNSPFQMMQNFDNFYTYGIITKVKMIMKTQTASQMITHMTTNSYYKNDIKFCWFLEAGTNDDSFSLKNWDYEGPFNSTILLA